MITNNRPIGIFDSGVGGLTVLKEITKLLPNEDILYFGDTARNPYGPRAKSVIEEYSYNIVKFFNSFNVKAIVVACNTASSLAINYLKESFPNIPIYGVIEPGVEAAINRTKNKKIGVLGTVGTIESGAYNNLIVQKEPQSTVFSQACPLFVPLIEEGWKDHKIMDIVIDEYLKDIKESGIDSIILGCTHYPIIKNKIQKYLGNNIEVIDSANAIANFLKLELKSKKLLNDNSKNGEIRYFVSNQPEKFRKIAYELIGNKLNNIQVVIW